MIPTLEADVSSAELEELAGSGAGAGPLVGAGAKTGGQGPAAARGTTSTSVVADGLKAKIVDLYRRGELEGIIAITGMTGALIVLPAMRELPFGVPKVLVSGATASRSTPPSSAASSPPATSR